MGAHGGPRGHFRLGGGGAIPKDLDKGYAELCRSLSRTVAVNAVAEDQTAMPSDVP
jgi:hypothetical protein